MISTADKLRAISMTLQIHKRLSTSELLAVMASLIELAERVEKLEADRVTGT
jgi:hypothetical protein